MDSLALNSINLNSENIKNLLTTYLVFFLILKEIKAKIHSPTQVFDQIASVFYLAPSIICFSFQLKMLYELFLLNKISEEKIYALDFVLHRYPEETLFSALDSISSKEMPIWAHEPKAFRESLSPFYFYAEILTPINSLNPYETLGVPSTLKKEEIKKIYKSLAQKFHPDKLAQHQLHPILVKKAQEKFGLIKKAYETIMQ